MNNYRKGMIALFVGCLGIGFAPILAKLAMYADANPSASAAGLSTLSAAFWRHVIAVPFFGLYVAVRSEPRAAFKDLLTNKKLLYGSILAGLTFGIDMALWHCAFDITTVANATLEANMANIFVVMFGCFVLGEKMRPIFYAGLVCAFTGIILLVQHNLQLNPALWLGDLLGILAAFAYASYILVVRHYVGNADPFPIMMIATFVTALFIAPLAYFYPGAFFPSHGLAWVYLIALALFSHFLGQGLIAYGLKFLPASIAGVMLLMQPVWVAWLGWLLLGQALSGLQLFAGALVLGGIYLSRRGHTP